MKRRLGLLAASAVLATVGIIAPSSPASAHTDECSGNGTASLSTGFGLPGVTSNTASFTFGFTVGAGVCASGGSLTASGTVTGACGSSTGTGTTNTGHSFSFTSAGTALVLTGGVTGTVSAVSDPTGGSCTNKTAQRFFITGSAALTH